MELSLRKRYIILYLSIILNLHSIRLLTVAGANAATFNSPLNSKLSFSSKEYRRLKNKGLEMMPIDEIASNTIGEPSCEELRAMWRYNKRQHRAAELSNQIPNLPNSFWHYPIDQPRSFGMFRSRGGHSFRPKGFRNKQDKIFGRVLLSPAATTEPLASQRLKPFEEVKQLLGNERPVKVSKIKEPVVHLMSPAEPTQETSFQKLKNLYREERVKNNKNANANANVNSNQRDSPASQSSPSTQQGSPQSYSTGIINPTPPPAVFADKQFGRLVLAPPKGQDGRIANKPKELMSPFERLRFGQIDDLLGIKDEIEGKHVLQNFPVKKRRNGFVGFPMLRQGGGTMSGVRDNGGTSGGSSSTSSLATGFFRPPHLGSASRILPAPQPQPNSTNSSGIVSAINSFDDSFDIPSRDAAVLLNANADDLQVQNEIASEFPEGPAFVVEIPSCPEVEHQFCVTNADCKCAGYGLYRCFHRQCQVLAVYSEDSDEYDANGNADIGDDGFWHSNSIPNSHLGMWDSNPILTVDDLKKRKRSA